jgi:ABC-type transport system involved in cytochrome bd biosynthesis fused ATPase/permease subunit
MAITKEQVFSGIFKGLGALMNVGILLLIILMLLIFLRMESANKKAMEAENKYRVEQMQRMTDLTKTLTDLATSNQKLAAQVGLKQEVAEKIKVDLGRSIRVFNRTVKELKQSTDPHESVERFHQAWDWRPE